MEGFSKSDLSKILNNIVLRNMPLSRTEAYNLMRFILLSDEDYIIPTWSAIFAAIENRGSTIEEIEGFAEAIRDIINFEIDNKRKPRISNDLEVVSLVGSGKDDVKTINVSTLSSLILASFGKVKVVKHDSYGSSGIFGSRDVIESFGIISKDVKEIRRNILKFDSIYFLPIEDFVKTFDERYHGNFLFFHPLSYVLAGLLHPYHLDWLVMGIIDFNGTSLSAKILNEYNYRGAVVSGEISGYGYIDELSPFGPSKVCYFCENKISDRSIVPSIFFAERIEPTKYIFQSNDLELEKKKFEDILKGSGPFEANALIALNAGLALSLVSEQSLRECVKECLEMIKSGQGYETWEKAKRMATYED